MPKGRLIANPIGAAGMTLCGPALADNYPAKPLKLIILSPPGDMTDIVGRGVTGQLSKVLSQAMTMEDKGGGGRSVGTDVIAKVAPGGYTIGIATASMHAVNPVYNPESSYDSPKDFEPVTNLTTVANVIVVNPTLPAKNYKEFVAALTANPDKYLFATFGTCGTDHMLGETLKVLTKTQMVHVSYHGTGPAPNDVLANQVPIMVDNLPSSIQFIKSGKLRPIVVAQNKRIDSLPDMLTLAGVGLKDANDLAWYGLITPTGTSDETIRKLSEASVKVLGEPGSADWFRGAGAEPVNNTSQQYTAETKHGFGKMRTFIKQQNIKLEQ